jgi:PAS domain S-box-containing protein
MIQVEQDKKGYFLIDFNNRVIEFSDSLPSIAGNKLDNLLNKKLTETNLLNTKLIQEVLENNFFHQPLVFYSKLFSNNPSFFEIIITKNANYYRVQLLKDDSDSQFEKIDYNLLVDQESNIIQSNNIDLVEKNLIDDLLPLQLHKPFHERFELAKKGLEDNFTFSHTPYHIQASKLQQNWFVSISSENNQQFENLFEKAITELSLSLLDASNSKDIDATINKGLGILGQYSNTDRAYIFSIDYNKNKGSIIYEWCNKGIEKVKDKLQNIPLKHFEWFLNKMKNSGSVFIDDIEHITDYHLAEKQHLKSHNIQSLLSVPVIKKGNIIGFISFDTVKGKRSWNKSEINLLKIAGKLFFNKINQFDNTKKQLQTESFYKNIFNNAKDAMLLIDQSTKTIVDANYAARKLYEIPIHLLNKITLNKIEKLSDEKSKLTNNGQLIVKHESLNGNRFTVEQHVSTATINNNEFILLVNRDITDKLQKSEELLKSRQRFKMISEATSDFSFSVIRDEKGARLDWCSDTLTKTFGEGNLDRLKNMLHPDDKTIYNEFLVRLEERGIADVELRLSIPRQKEYWIHLSAKLYKESHQVRITGAARDINEKKKAEFASKESDNRFQFLFENMPYGLITLRFYQNEFLIKNANKKIEDIIEIKKNELIGKNIKEFKNLANELILNSIYSVHTKLKSKYLANYLYDNKILEIYLYQLPTKEVVLMIQDITDKSKTERELLESQKSYKILFNNANDSIFIHDLEGKIIKINSVACKKLRYSHNELIKKHAFDLESPANRKDFDKRFNYLLENGKNKFETELIRKDNKLVPMEIASRLIKYQQKIVVLTTASDITERRIAEEKLNYELQLNKSISIFAEELLASQSSVSDLANRILHVARSITESKHGFVTEINEERSKNKNTITAISAEGCFVNNDGENNDDTKIHELLTDQVLKNRKPFFTNTPINKPDGKTKLPDGHFHIQNFISVPVIADEHIMGQIAMANSSRSYSERDVDAIMRIANLYALAIRMERSKKELEIRNSELNNFVYKVSHDLRAPLASIAGLVNVITLLPMDEQPKSYIELIENRIQKLDRFINDILSHSRNLNTEIKYDRIELKNIITEAVAELNYMEEARDVKVHLQIEEGEFISDILRIREIIRNLLSNGFKYHNPYQKLKFIKIQAHIDINQIHIIYEDNGLGIDPIALPKIFDMFYKGSDRSNSSGLGLYIAKQAIDKLRGSILVQSEKGKGTQFDITIPNRTDSLN